MYLNFLIMKNMYIRFKWYFHRRKYQSLLSRKEIMYSLWGLYANISYFGLIWAISWWTFPFFFWNRRNVKIVINELGENSLSNLHITYCHQFIVWLSITAIKTYRRSAKYLALNRWVNLKEEYFRDKKIIRVFPDTVWCWIGIEV